jgi:hypothetical protein
LAFKISSEASMGCSIVLLLSSIKINIQTQRYYFLVEI